MTPLALKSYQQAAFDALKRFAHLAQIKGPALAFGETPCVCLRIPTGGGKTLMAGHAVAVLAQAWRATDVKDRDGVGLSAQLDALFL